MSTERKTAADLIWKAKLDDSTVSVIEAIVSLLAIMVFVGVSMAYHHGRPPPPSEPTQTADNNVE
jgi:hypothetical protein